MYAESWAPVLCTGRPLLQLSAGALDKQFAGPAGKDMKPPVDTVAEDFEKALVPVMARF